MIDVCLRFSNETAMRNRLKSLGIIWKDCETPPSVDEDTGIKYIMQRLRPSDADKFPPDNNPAFALVWRSDEDGDLPTFSVKDMHIDTGWLGTYRQQTVGRIA